MPNKQLKTAFQFILGGFIIMNVAVSCNDTSSTSETKKDSTAVADSAKMDKMSTDTMKMDTAAQRPIVNPPN
ncbi:MAG: hypothetical protein JWN83_1468 [Chitinophagaceae bacterium]|nr:hypothetical protein [Chitinophagaceae bacterium]